MQRKRTKIYPRVFKIRKFKAKYSNSIKNWTAIRETILERDNYVCRICGLSNGEEPLNIHHIDWNRTHNQDNNLVTLCSKCHRQVHFEQYKPYEHPDYPTPW
jgi:5-methylcytosine-specific restriction endonuclease McrA